MNGLKRMLLGLAIFAAMVLAGCASMNEAECVAADWAGVGYEDGAQGRDAAYVANHRTACAEFGVTPDMAEYRQGYEDGIAYYCRADNGFTQGRSGRSYNGICPANLAGPFLVAYNQGRELYQLSTSISQAARTISANNDEIEAKQDSIAEKEARLISDDTPQAERAALLEEVRELEQQIGRLEAETLELERRRAVLNQQYAELEASYSPF